MQLKNETTAVSQTDYTDDGLSRLATVSGSDVTAAYARVSGSSMLNSTTVNNGAADVVTVTRTYDNLNRLNSISSVAAETKSRTYQYDDQNQQIKCTFANRSSWTYSYDGLGQISSEKKYQTNATTIPEHSFGYNFNNISNRTSTNTGNDLSQYTAKNIIYSCINTTYGKTIDDETNTQPYTYDSFAKPYNTKTEIAPNYHIYSYDSPKFGSWVSRDPIGEDGGVNLYGFIYNDGINAWDWLGSFSLKDLKKLITNSVTGTAESIYNFLQKHPLSKTDITIINYLIAPVKRSAASVVDTNTKTMGWLDLAMAWLFELGPPQFKFKDGDNTTEEIKTHHGVNEARKKAITACKNKESSPISYHWGYNVNEFWASIIEVDTAAEFLGSYDVEVSFDSKCCKFKFKAINKTGWESGTRFRKGKKPGGPHLGIISNRARGSGGIQLGGTIMETWEWTETENQ